MSTQAHTPKRIKTFGRHFAAPASQHTPAPWVQSAQMICGPELPDGGRSIVSGKMAPMDAAHIVKCVNAHDELVAALRSLVDLVEIQNTTECERARALLARLEV